DAEVLNEGGLKLSERGVIMVDKDTCSTSIKGIFAAGDATHEEGNSVIQAIAEGKKYAISIDQYLQGKSPEEIPEQKAVNRKSVFARSIDEQESSRIDLPKIDINRRKSSFDTIEVSLTEEEAVREASRCLACGCGVGCGKCQQVCIYDGVDLVDDKYVINEKNCDGCGMCVEICPNDAIKMVEKE
ncbi:hypothetical protein FJZ33_08680, partial [Candidatus Poribacteria bacterium]|nr:hypothetical protein [Candidatus Poribacteria bacterium]